MYKFLVIGLIILLAFNSSQAQTLKLTCSEKERKTDYTKYPVIIKTCIIKNFKFISTSYPDDVGRYFDNETEVFVRVNNKYIKTTNSNVFNKNQEKLLALINDQIQKDFKAFKTDANVKECLLNIDSIPKYQMDNLEISFYKDEIWFEVHWGLVSACRSVDGTVVPFKLRKVSKYFK